MSGSRTRAGDASGNTGDHEVPWYRRKVGVILVFGYTCFTAAGILVSMGVGGFIAPEHTVPVRMYLYVVVGVSGYVFTALIADFHRSVRDLVKVGIRIPASLTLGLGVYLLAALVAPESADSSRVVAGLVFLTGLYTNMTFKGLGALAERLYWGEPPEKRGGSSD